MTFMNKKCLTKNPLCNKSLAAIIILITLAVIFFVGVKKNNSVATNPSEAAIEKVITKWIANNPEAIIDSVQNMQRKAMEDQQKNAQKNISVKKNELFNDKNSPQNISSGYDVTVVEFFDYSCGYCKRAALTVEQLTAQDKKVRFVHKHFPILGEASTQMAQTALAINIAQPNLYAQFHKEMMKSQARGKSAAIDVAKKIGANIALIEKTLNDKESEINSMIEENLKLGASIGINGTPGFVIGEELIPGAIDLESFKAKIAEARK